jgi:undecaprenyl-diphosphatase
MDSIYAVIMGVVEGLTEFLPISSTGHLILADHLLGFKDLPFIGEDFAKAFEVIIQLGAILAIVAAYPRRFLGLFDFRAGKGFSGLNGITLLAITSIPAGLVGYATEKYIDKYLFCPATVAAALAVGAVWILAVEWISPRPRKEGIDSLTWKESLGIGMFQCLSLWPGMSRAACTILGGMICGAERKTATEYSFFAAVPIMIVATLHKLVKIHHSLTPDRFQMLAIGFVVSFICALLAVKFFIHFLTRHTLAPFGWYRLVVAGLVVWFIVSGGGRGAGTHELLDLNAAALGELPQGWVAAKTGEGPGSVWQVVEDAGAPGGKALAQTSADGPKALFNLCVAEESRFLNSDLRVDFKAVAGEIDQGGGLVWRYKDAKNYYLSRMNPLEDNLRLYKVVDGTRTQLATVDVKAAAGKWHSLRIVQEGDRVRCYFNGRLELEAEDKTLGEPGKVGLWTKADAQTRFAGLQFEGK